MMLAGLGMAWVVYRYLGSFLPPGLAQPRRVWGASLIIAGAGGRGDGDLTRQSHRAELLIASLGCPCDVPA